MLPCAQLAPALLSASGDDEIPSRLSKCFVAGEMCASLEVDKPARTWAVRVADEYCDEE